MNNLSLPRPRGIIYLLFVYLFFHLLFILWLLNNFSTWWQLRRWRCTPPILTTRLPYSQLNEHNSVSQARKDGKCHYFRMRFRITFTWLSLALFPLISMWTRSSSVPLFVKLNQDVDKILCKKFEPLERSIEMLTKFCARSSTL